MKSKFYTIIDRMEFIQTWMFNNNITSFGEFTANDEKRYQRDHDAFFNGKRFLDRNIYAWQGKQKFRSIYDNK